MKLSLDRRKYRQRILILGLFSCLFPLSLGTHIGINLYKHSFNSERILVGVFLALITLFFCTIFRHFFRLRKIKDAVLTFEHGELNDYTKIFNRAKSVKIENISSIDFWTTYRGVTQIKIVLKDAKSSKTSLSDQLSGKHIYVSDYVLNLGELEKFLEEIKSQIR